MILFSKAQGILEGVEAFHTQGNFEFFLKNFLTNFFRDFGTFGTYKKRMPILKKGGDNSW